MDFMICFIFAQFIIFNFEGYLGTKWYMPLFWCSTHVSHFLASSGDRQSCNNANLVHISVQTNKISNLVKQENQLQLSRVEPKLAIFNQTKSQNGSILRIRICWPSPFRCIKFQSNYLKRSKLVRPFSLKILMCRHFGDTIIVGG